MCFCLEVFFVFKQKTAYEMRISDWSSDVCSSDLAGQAALVDAAREAIGDAPAVADLFAGVGTFALSVQAGRKVYAAEGARDAIAALTGAAHRARTLVATEHRDLFRRTPVPAELRSEERSVGKEGVSHVNFRLSPYH